MTKKGSKCIIFPKPGPSILRREMKSWWRRRRRSYSTSYIARVVSAGDGGRTMAVEVAPPSDLDVDPRGHPLPRRYLVCRVAQILRSQSPTSDPLLDLSDYLSTLSHPITPSEVGEVLKSLQTPERALPFFRFAADSLPGYRHDCFAYNRILLILVNADAGAGAGGRVRWILDEMERAGVRGNISTVNILIRVFEGAKELGRCLELVKKWGLRFTCYTYKCLVQAYLRSSELDMAFGVFLEMRRRGYALDIFVYNNLLDSLAKEEKVMSLFVVFFFCFLFFLCGFVGEERC